MSSVSCTCASGMIPRYGSLGRRSGSTSLSSMKHVRGSTWRKNSDEIRKILGHSIAVDNIHETMEVEVEC
ncbi:hypothetical protein RHMOL_Rhmol01G0098200 [Rhododendron molle]|nr:hypothetical protein RHMOL_Rhmol01G0098200 [Rhododendron molle]